MNYALVALALMQGQTKDMKVTAPTRLDWQFAASGFGQVRPLPGDYDSTRQKYVLFVPAKQSKACVLFISPSNDGTGLAQWQSVCEREGILFCSPYGAGND